MRRQTLYCFDFIRPECGGKAGFQVIGACRQLHMLTRTPSTGCVASAASSNALHLSGADNGSTRMGGLAESKFASPPKLFMSD